MNPPLPPSAFCQVLFTVAVLVSGEPLPCVPPSRMSALVGCTETETNSVIDPRVCVLPALGGWLKLSN